VDAGLATRERRPPAAPGRPSIGYQAAAGGGPAGEHRYRLLAEMLTSPVAGLLTEPAAAAQEAGREWGGYLAGQPPPCQRPTVCSPHLGLMRGALARLRAPVTAGRLEPFARPGVCVTDLTAPGEPAPRGQSGSRRQRVTGPGKGPR